MLKVSLHATKLTLNQLARLGRKARHLRLLGMNIQLNDKLNYESFSAIIVSSCACDNISASATRTTAAQGIALRKASSKTEKKFIKRRLGFSLRRTCYEQTQTRCRVAEPTQASGPRTFCPLTHHPFSALLFYSLRSSSAHTQSRASSPQRGSDFMQI